MLSLNVYGIPWNKQLAELLNTTYKDIHKEERIAAIANFIVKQDYDLYLLQELWLKNDYEIIKKALPANMYITTFHDFNVHSCTVVVLLPPESQWPVLQHSGDRRADI